eukprot:6829542-Prorocentrum_lima.AAC.1
MTSSLVGSEMCIRDRYHELREQTTKRMTRFCHAQLPLQRELVRLTPVSYTHLTLPTICSV